ncbi:YceD family protein [Pararhizobium mangrovi]|uniref:DUF177 domain-containing protein n=1 Tax=Pararhizobium mangrovi TaxID=2590452 RepID=A0A506UD87_9HYPH|nr:DUF177 domain-containing protein [Pararhizobium mangrovi]TPW31900.1 DUF177 domain-containing protein [Pararhizobium mangrovi]
MGGYGGKGEAGGYETFSHRVRPEHLGEGTQTVQLSASEADRARLADEWGVLGVERLDAELTVRRWRRDGIRVEGRVTGDLMQECVVTLDPVKTRLDETIEALFVPQGSRNAGDAPGSEGEIVVDPEAPDPPETFSGDALDLADVAREFAALGIDPYPHVEDVAFTDHVEDEAGEEESPFAALRQLRKGDG